MRLGPALALILAAAPALQAADADYLLLNARVFSGSAEAPPQALAIAGSRILALGAAAEAARGSSTTVYDLGGRWVVPGFNDAHLHFMEGALAPYQVDLTTAASAADAARMVKAFAAAHPDEPWVLGGGWSHTNFPGGEYPSKADLDSVVPDRPVLLEHVDGHLVWANSEALRRAGIGAQTEDPPNGSLLREPGSRRPTGVLLEAAGDLVEKAVPPPSPERRREALSGALALARSLGVTSIQGLLSRDASAELSTWRVLAGSAPVTLRYFLWGRLEDPEGFLRLAREFADLPRDRFTFGGVKGFVDGVISARTAVLSQPYTDARDVNGVPNYTQEELNRLVLKANRLGLQVELHAIGDAAVRMALDAFASSRRALGAATPRNKIEHVELLDPRDLPRFRALDVVASVQPSHCTYDTQSQNYNSARLGARARWSFAWRSLQEAGAPLAFGTDWPVMPLDPRIGLFAAVTRLNFDGGPPGGWFPGQRLPLAEALRHYTEGSAYAQSRSRDLGTLEPGFLADLVVMGPGLFEAAGTALMKVPIEAVFFDGRPVYQGEGLR